MTPLRPALVVGSRVSYESISSTPRAAAARRNGCNGREAAELPENRAMDEEQAGDGGIGDPCFFLVKSSCLIET